MVGKVWMWLWTVRIPRPLVQIKLVRIVNHEGGAWVRCPNNSDTENPMYVILKKIASCRFIFTPFLRRIWSRSKLSSRRNVNLTSLYFCRGGKHDVGGHRNFYLDLFLQFLGLFEKVIQNRVLSRNFDGLNDFVKDPGEAEKEVHWRLYMTEHTWPRPKVGGKGGGGTLLEKF